MYHWLKAAMQGASADGDLFQVHRQILRNRDAIDRLLPLELRDRWGYPLEPYKLAEVAAFIQANADLDGLKQRSRERGAMVEIVDRLALEMLSGDSFPQFCSGYDTPAEDGLIETVVRTTLNLKEPSA